MFRTRWRFASFVAITALVQAMAAPMLRGCEHSDANLENAAAPSQPTDHSAHGRDGTACMGTETSPGGQHDDDCLSSCKSVMGCSTLGMLAETRMSTTLEESPQVSTRTTFLYRGRSPAPDRPPPKL